MFEPSPGHCDGIRRVRRQPVDQHITGLAHQLKDHGRNRLLAGGPVSGDTTFDPRRCELMHRESRRRSLGQNDAASFADAQRGLHTLAIERLLQSQLVRRIGGQQRPKLLSQRAQTVWQFHEPPPQAQHAGSHQSHIAPAAPANCVHDVAGSHRERNADILPRRAANFDFETAVPDHLSARVDTQNPHHRHAAECKVCAVKIAMLLLAAGRGSRFGGPVPKAYLQLGGQPLVVASATRLVRALPSGCTFELLVLVHADDRASHAAACRPQLELLTRDRGTFRILAGGASRQQSMQNGLAACDPEADLVLVHDAARALLPIEATRACIAAAAASGAALLAIPAPDTLKRVVADRVIATLDRTSVWLAQTPQVIRRELLVRAFAHAAATGFVGTDDVSLVEHLGEPVTIVRGSPTNLKITQPEDLPLAEAIAAANLA